MFLTIYYTLQNAPLIEKKSGSAGAGGLFLLGRYQPDPAVQAPELCDKSTRQVARRYLGLLPGKQLGHTEPGSTDSRFLEVDLDRDLKRMALAFLERKLRLGI